MSHELEFFDGQAAFAGRSPAWHRLGTVRPDLTFAEAVEATHLYGWDVRAEPFTILLGDITEDAPVREHETAPADEHQAIVRNNPATGRTEVLGVVGGRYKTVQNEQAFAHVEFLESLGAKTDSVGSIRGGRQVFVSMTLDGGWSIDPEGADDKLAGFLLNRTSHDGSVAVEACSTWVRVVCANTWDAVPKGVTRAYKVRHTATAADRLAVAQTALVQAQQHGEKFAKLANALHQTKMTTGEFTKLATAFYPKPGSGGDAPPESKRGLTIWEKKITLLGDLFTGGGDVEFTLGNVRGTAWAGVNAMTERLDWHRTSRGQNDTLAIAASGFVPAVTNEKQELLDMVTEWAAERNPKAFAGIAI